MKIPYYHVDAFTDRIFAGNPAGVCLLEYWPTDAILQSIAAENSLSETAFVVAAGEEYQLRWFTPQVEIDLCGHATLAAAFVLYRLDRNTAGPIRFTTKSGDVSVSRRDDLLILDFPARPAQTCGMPENLVRGLGLTPSSVYKSRDYLAVFEHEKQITDLDPDFALLAALDCVGIIVTAPGDQVDFVSRFFAPGAGIPEDPVTGSAYCTLIPYWADQLARQELQARQLSQRGGTIFCENKGERVFIGGSAILYSQGTLIL